MKQDAPHKKDVIDGSGVDKGILSLLWMVLSDFHRQNICYCYWKSIGRIYRGLTGEGDLDLLVSNEDQHRAQAILLGRGLKRFPCVACRDHPAILSFLGYDEPSGRIVHLHLHFRLVAGNSLLKNYRLPWEEAILARTIVHPMLSIRMLDPVNETLLCIVRSCLELRRSDPIALRDWRAAERKFALDRRELAARVDRVALGRRAAELLGHDLADTLADTIYGDPTRQDQRRLRRRIQRHFAAHRAYNTFEAGLRSLGRAVLWAGGNLNKRFLWAPRPWSRRAPCAGRVVAVIGVDGSGKSTVVATIRAWLSQEMDVVPIYFGTGDGRPSLVLWPFKLMVPLITLLLRTKPKGASHGKISNRAPGLVYSVFLMVWATVAAIEKRIKLSAAHRGANRGLVILTDRYPQNEIVGFNEGPLMSRLTTAPLWLRRFEAAAYSLAHRLPPDLVIKLVVTPETAARREPNMDPAVIRTRIAEVPQLAFPGARVVCIDAEQSLADVIRAVKREIWRLL
jgi:thymidylate kinase